MILGILLCLIRLQDDYFREKLRRIVASTFCRSRKEDITQTSAIADAWDIPLSNLIAMTASYEIIYGILNGVCSTLQNPTEIHQHPKNAYLHSTIRKIVGQGIELNQINPNSVNQSEIGIKESGIEENLLSLNQTKLKIQEYAPAIFMELRLLDGISNEQIHNSLLFTNNINSITSLSESAGKSGAFFFFSQDKKFIIKTLTQAELNLLRKRFLPAYHKYIKTNRFTMLARLYGCFSIFVGNLTPIHIILIENSFEHIGSPDKVFDLKGSLVNRRSQSFVKKDLNLLESDQPLMFFGQDDRKRLFEQLRLDSVFLIGMNIMDYSLLMGVKQVVNPLTAKTNSNQWSRNVQFKDQVYSLTIIDYLQEFNTQKYLEGKYKSMFSNVQLISSVDPQQYSDRFLQFMNGILCEVIVHG